MADIGNAIKYLYEKLILRDVLSFITPGAMVVITATYTIYPDFFNSWYVPWPLYIPIFGLFFLIGFAIQCFGRLVGVIKIHKLDDSTFKQRLSIFSGRLKEKDDCTKGARENVMDFLNTVNGSDWAKQHYERSVVLKQMCGNGFWALIISCSYLAINDCSLLAKVAWVSVWVLLFLASLFWGYRDSEIALSTVECKVNELDKEGKLYKDK